MQIIAIAASMNQRAESLKLLPNANVVLISFADRA
jgi:hypothetical protein